MSGSKAGLILGIAAGLAIVAGIATAALISYCCSSEDGDGWETYRNDFLGFEIDYPDTWHLEERGHTAPSPGGFITGGVRILREADEPLGPDIHAYKHFQGDWCLLGRLEEEPINVSGVPGVETNCYGCEDDAPKETCPADPYIIVRFFGSFAPDDGSYAVVGETGDFNEDIETVRRIVESFRFID